MPDWLDDDRAVSAARRCYRTGGAGFVLLFAYLLVQPIGA